MKAEAGCRTISPSSPTSAPSSTLLRLESSKGFEEELQKRATARMAIIQTDVDRLLRRYFGNSVQFQPGQLLYASFGGTSKPPTSSRFAGRDWLVF